MATLSVQRDVAASPQRVWSIVTDLDGIRDVISAITAVERTDSGTGFGVGTAWKETRVMFGREMTEPMEVTAVDEGRSYTVESTSRGVHYTSIMKVEPRGDGTTLAWEFGAEATSTSAKLMAIVGKLFEGSTRKALAKDLDDIAAAAEADST